MTNAEHIRILYEGTVGVLSNFKYAVIVMLILLTILVVDERLNGTDY